MRQKLMGVLVCGALLGCSGVVTAVGASHDAHWWTRRAQDWRPEAQHTWRVEEFPQIVMDYMERDGEGRYVVVPHGTTVLALTPIGEDKAAPLSHGDHLICRPYNDVTIWPPDLKFVGFKCGDRKFVMTSLDIRP